jgi:pectinesterase
MKKLIFVLLFASSAFAQSRFPADKAMGVNPDTHLVLTFKTAPTLGKSGQIRIYDASDNKVVDTLDLSIPSGPTAGAGGPNPPYLDGSRRWRR